MTKHDISSDSVLVWLSFRASGCQQGDDDLMEAGVGFTCEDSAAGDLVILRVYQRLIHSVPLQLWRFCSYKISGVEENQENETTKRDSPHGILRGDLSGLDRSSRHIDEEQLFSCNLIRWERTSWNWKAESICCCRKRKEGGREGGEIKKNGEMLRSEESWLFVKDSDRKRPRQAKLIDGCWQVPDVGFYNIVSLSH